MAKTVVDTLHEEYSDLLKVLDKAGEISLRTTAADNFRKSLLVSAASYFEHRVTEDVIAFFKDTSGANNLITAFVRNKVVRRQFHTWFEWNARNANQFFSLFGLITFFGVCFGGLSRSFCASGRA